MEGYSLDRDFVERLRRFVPWAERRLVGQRRHAGQAPQTLSRNHNPCCQFHAPALLYADGTGYESLEFRHIGAKLSWGAAIGDPEAVGVTNLAPTAYATDVACLRFDQPAIYRLQYSWAVTHAGAHSDDPGAEPENILGFTYWTGTSDLHEHQYTRWDNETPSWMARTYGKYRLPDESTWRWLYNFDVRAVLTYAYGGSADDLQVSSAIEVLFEAEEETDFEMICDCPEFLYQEGGGARIVHANLVIERMGDAP